MSFMAVIGNKLCDKYTKRNHGNRDSEQKLGISEERAQELEVSITKPQLTDDEQEYLKMYHEHAKKAK